MSPSKETYTNSAKLWLQAACIFATAVALGIVYNSASPLGVRPGGAIPGDTAGRGAPVEIPQQGYFNETVSLRIEDASRPSTQNPVVAPSPPTGTAPPAIPTLTWPQVENLMGTKKVVLVDARGKQAYDLGHIPGAVLLSANASPAELQAFAAKYPRDTALVLYCASTTCRASEQLARLLVSSYGYRNVSELPGGFAEYTLAQTARAKPRK